MSRAHQPMSVVIGRVLLALQGTHHYEVATDFGRLQATFHGWSRGGVGVAETGSLAPGTFVWVAWGEGELVGQILGVTVAPWPVNPDDPRQLLSFPQVAGFEDDKRFSGRLYRRMLEIEHRTVDVGNDMVNGEWAMRSPHGLGGGVGVELFRSWVQGGPMSGLWCWHDSQLTRLAGLNFEFRTLGQDDYDRTFGNALMLSRSRVFYPGEALDDLLPRELELQGPIHGGRQRFVAPAAPRGTARPALFHEHIATDGAYRLTSARSVVIERYCGVVVPEETLAPDVAEQPLGDQPLDAPELREETLRAPRHTLAGAAGGLAWVQQSIDLIESLTAKGRGAAERLPGQFVPAVAPAGVPADLFHVTYTAAMWRRLPTSAGFEIELDAVEGKRTFYVGRSSVTLLPDGSVVIEDANHSQITMAGGSIMISCPNDLVLAPGRNLVAIAGRDAAVRANRHVDVSANEGRVSIKAEDLLQLLGGNGGAGGVLLESRTLNEQATEGTGTEQSVGGILLKSATGVYAQGTRVGLTATQDVILRAETGRILGLTQQVALRAEGGLLVQFGDEANGPSYLLGETSAIMPGQVVMDGQLFCEGVFSEGDIIVKGSLAATENVVGVGVAPVKVPVPAASIASVSRAIATSKAAGRRQANAVDVATTAVLALATPLVLADSLGFSFATTAQLGLAADDAFELPETRWQAVAASGYGLSDVWAENPVVSPAGDNQPTAALPGFEAWSTSARLRRDELHPFFDLLTGQPLRPEEAELLDNPTIPLDKNWRIAGGPR